MSLCTADRVRSAPTGTTPMAPGNSLYLSVVVPAYNEERRVLSTLDCILAYIQTKEWTAEIIVVDDGSTDGTMKVVKSLTEQRPEIRVLTNGYNRGKGFSVRRGILESRGRYVLFSDADLSAPIEETDKLLAALERGWDVVIGSRAVDRGLLEVPQGKLRRLTGVVFRHLVHVLLGVPFLDTQCGFKAFRRATVLSVFRQQRIERFGFDPEILFLALRQGLGILEVGVRWRNDPDTRVRFLRDGARMVFDLFRIRWFSLTGQYEQPCREAKPEL